MKSALGEYVAFDANIATHKEMGHLSVNGALLGRSHLFAFEGKAVRLQLPLAEASVVPDSACFRHRHYTRDPDNPAASSYYVYRVMIETELLAPVSADSRVFKQHPNAYDVVPSADQAKYQRLIDENVLLLSAAFDRWQRVARWVSRNSLIGAQASRGGSHSARIVRRSDRQSVWVGTSVAMVRRAKDLTLQDWQSMQAALDAGVEPPIWFDYLAEGVHRVEVEDHPGALLSLAIGCETMMRALLWAKAGRPSNPLAALLIDRANAQTIIGHWAELLEITKPEARTWKLSALHEMFDTRNKLIHEGTSASLNHAKLEGYKKAVQEFLDRADEVVRAAAGQRDYRSPSDA